MISVDGSTRTAMAKGYEVALATDRNIYTDGEGQGDGVEVTSDRTLAPECARG